MEKQTTQNHLPENNLTKENLDVSEMSVKAAIGTALQKMIGEEKITSESRDELIGVAEDRFYEALSEGYPYGGALAFALEAGRGFENPVSSYDQAVETFWHYTAKMNGHTEYTQDQIDEMSTKYNLDLIAAREQEKAIQTEKELGRIAAEQAAVGVEIEQPDSPAVTVEVKQKSKERRQNNPEPDVEYRSSWRRALPEFDAEHLVYNGKINGKPVEKQPVMITGYGAEKSEEYDGGIATGEEEDTRGAAIFAANDGTEFYLHGGYMSIRKLTEINGKKRFRDTGEAVRVTGIYAVIGEPLKIFTEWADGQVLHTHFIHHGALKHAKRIVPNSKARGARNFDLEKQTENIINMWNRLRKRMDTLIAKH